MTTNKEENILVGYKGTGDFVWLENGVLVFMLGGAHDTGYFYCPYIPNVQL